MSTVLIADDHSFLRAGLRAILRNSHYTLAGETANGTDTLDAVGKLAPDIVLLDVVMPAPDGIEVLEQLRARGDFRPVVLLTGDLDDHQLLRALRSEVNGIILKNGAEDHLLRCLDTVASGKKAISREILERALNASVQLQQSPFAKLTPRERDIVDLVGRGLRNREVAERLHMTEGTIKVYLHSIYQKLGVSNRTELSLILRRELGID